MVKRKKKRLFKTSFDNFHRHSWSLKDKFTSKDFGHRHRVDLRRGLALLSGGHNHKLLKSLYKKRAKKR